MQEKIAMAIVGTFVVLQVELLYIPLHFQPNLTLASMTFLCLISMIDMTLPCNYIANICTRYANLCVMYVPYEI